MSDAREPTGIASHASARRAGGAAGSPRKSRQDLSGGADANEEDIVSADANTGESVSRDGQQEARLPLRLSMDDAEPLYRQVEEQLRDLIVSGRLPAGTRLPSVRALARELACSVITTRRAYQDLTHEGLIRTRQGMGAVVADVGDRQREQHRRDVVFAAIRDAVETGRHMGCSQGELEEIFASVVRDVPSQDSDREK